MILKFEISHIAGARKHERLRIEFLLNEIKYLLFVPIALAWRQSAALISATQHAMPPEICGKWGTEVT